MGGYRCNKLQVLEMSEENGFLWTVKADLPAARWNAASAVVDRKLWLMGGCTADERGRSNSVIIYSIASDSWAAGPALPRQMKDRRASIHDGQLYLFPDLMYDGTGWVERGERPTAEGCACESILLG